MIEIPKQPLAGKRRTHSRRGQRAIRLPNGSAKAFRALGAELAITYGHEKSKAYVEPLARELAASIFLPCDVRQPGQLEAVFQAVEQKWNVLDFALHAIAFAPKRRSDLLGPLRWPRRGW